MSYRKIFWGLLLVIIGILFILKNTGVLLFSWHTIWQLWPVILILWGISLIPVKDWIKLVISFATIVIAFFAMQQYGPRDNHNWHFNWDDRSEYKHEKDATVSYSNHFSEEYDTAIQFAKLNLNVGVGQFIIEDTCFKLVEVSHNNSEANYSMTAKTEDSLCTVELKLDKGEFNGGQIDNTVRMQLNPNPIWDLDLNVGAAEVNFDLTPFKTRNVNIQGGASDIEVKVGGSLPFSEIRVEAGAASITIRVPESAGCEITSNTFMASRNFEGFEKIAKQHYQTPNFATATNKIKIYFQAGVASVDVVRY